jgi:hypothetical protein
MMVMVMVVAKLEDQVLQLGKEEREKQKQVLIKSNVSNRFLFWHSRHHRGLSVFRIDSRTINRENIWISGYRVPLGDMILAYALGT